MNWPLFFVNSQIRLSMDTNTAQKGWTFGLKSHLRRDGSVKHVRLLRPLGERAGDQQLTDGWAVRSQAWLFSPLGCFLQTLSDMCTERRPTRGLQLQPSPPREKTSSTEAHLRFKPLYQLFFFFWCTHGCKWTIYRSHATAHRSTSTRIKCSRRTHTLQRLPVPSPNWIVCSDNPQDSRSIDVRSRPMKIQGPWGAEGAMHIFTAWLATSSTTKEHITASVYLNGKCHSKKAGPYLHKALPCSDLHAAAVQLIWFVTSMDVTAPWSIRTNVRWVHNLSSWK